MYFSEVFGPIKWHMLACVAVFYALPALKFVLPPDATVVLFLIANFANIAVISVTCIRLTLKEGFMWYYPLVMIVIYAPSLMLYYEPSMMINVLTYLMLGYICQIIGIIVGKIIERNR